MPVPTLRMFTILARPQPRLGGMPPPAEGRRVSAARSKGSITVRRELTLSLVLELEPELELSV